MNHPPQGGAEIPRADTKPSAEEFLPAKHDQAGQDASPPPEQLAPREPREDFPEPVAEFVSFVLAALALWAARFGAAINCAERHLRRLYPRHIAEAAVEQTVDSVVGLLSSGTVQDVKHPTAWVKRVAYRAASRLLDQMNRRPAFLHMGEFAGELPADDGPRHAPPVQAMSAALEMLPDQEVRALFLMGVEGGPRGGRDLNRVEAAALLGVSLARARRLRNRAEERLRVLVPRILRQWGYDELDYPHIFRR